MNIGRLPEWCLRIGMIYLILGMGFGVFMGVTEDFSYRDVHAHFNLLGYASTFLIGLFLKAYPSTLKSRFAVLSVYAVLVSVALMLVLLTMLYLGYTEVGPALGVASVLVPLAYICFAIALFRSTARG